MDAMLDRPREPTRHWLNVNDNPKWPEAGILKPNGTVELIEGKIIDMVPIGSPDAGTTNRLTRVVRPRRRGYRSFRQHPSPFQLHPSNLPQPLTSCC